MNMLKRHILELLPSRRLAERAESVRHALVSLGVDAPSEIDQCTEAPIFRRERMVNLPIVPYILSKLVVLAPVLLGPPNTLAQARVSLRSSG